MLEYLVVRALVPLLHGQLSCGAQAAAAKVADSDADLKLLKGDIARVSNNLFKHMNRDQVEKYFEALDCNNPEPPAEVPATPTEVPAATGEV